MTSEELNIAIRTIADDETIDYECFGGKKIPYLGWFWRTVDFLIEDASNGQEGNILVFTSSDGENNPEHVNIIRQLASVNIDLGMNNITGHELEMHIVYIDQLHDKIKQLKFD